MKNYGTVLEKLVAWVLGREERKLQLQPIPVRKGKNE